MLREFDHRSVIYNSLPTCMSERQGELDSAGILGRHFVFSVESPQEVDTVIRAFRDGRPLEGKVRRI